MQVLLIMWHNTNTANAIWRSIPPLFQIFIAFYMKTQVSWCFFSWRECSFFYWKEEFLAIMFFDPFLQQLKSLTRKQIFIKKLVFILVSSSNFFSLSSEKCFMSSTRICKRSKNEMNIERASAVLDWNIALNISCVISCWVECLWTLKTNGVNQ